MGLILDVRAARQTNIVVLSRTDVITSGRIGVLEPRFLRLKAADFPIDF
jgi:hypothetical protein